jgi:Family of unknown function (DUF6912)
MTRMSEEPMRVYVPSTLTALAAALDSATPGAGALGPPPTCAYAVTPALREWYASGDLEELEYAAMTAAARASLRLIAATPGAPRRRVVLAAEMPAEAVSRADGDADRAAIVVWSAVPLDKVVSAHIDDLVAAPDVHAAIGALDAADKGDDDARFIVDGAEGHELLWYAASEIPYLL